MAVIILRHSCEIDCKRRDFFWIDLIEQKQGAGDDLATNRQEPKRRQGVGD